MHITKPYMLNMYLSTVMLFRLAAAIYINCDWATDLPYSMVS